MLACNTIVHQMKGKFCCFLPSFATYCEARFSSSTSLVSPRIPMYTFLPFIIGFNLITSIEIPSI